MQRENLFIGLSKEEFTDLMVDAVSTLIEANFLLVRSATRKVLLLLVLQIALQVGLLILLVRLLLQMSVK